MRKITIVLALGVLLLSSVGVGVAIDSIYLERPSSIPVSESTDVSQNPLVTIEELSPYPSGTQNVPFVKIHNNYDEPQTVTVSVSNADFSFSDGSNSKTVTIQPSNTQTLYIDTKGPTTSCSEVNNRRSNTYTYETTGNTLSINTTQSTVKVCRPGGGGGPPGGGGGPPGGGGGPPGGGGGPPGGR